jgi:hypothetical protein
MRWPLAPGPAERSLGLVTVVALCPRNWEFHLVDWNVRGVSGEGWAWAELVMLSAMIVQKKDLL